MILIIDNYDSFTYNLYQQIEALGKKTAVFQNDKISLKEIEKMKPSKIVISPGPGKPEESGISSDVIKKFYTKIPILGVCLGHECIGEIFGAKAVHAKEIMHGKTSIISHTGHGIFNNTKKKFRAARYHSLILNKVPKDFNLTAWTTKNEIMAITHTKFPLYGVQFHPESFLTENGDKLMHNFLYET